MVKGRLVFRAQSRPASFFRGWISTVAVRFSPVNYLFRVIPYANENHPGWEWMKPERDPENYSLNG